MGSGDVVKHILLAQFKQVTQQHLDELIRGGARARADVPSMKALQ